MDRILARDGLNEQVRCGAGDDSAILDPGDLTAQDCERLDVGSSAEDGATIPGGAGTTPGPTTATRTADPYAKCRRLKANKKKACVRRIRALKRFSKLRGNKKKACIKKATRRFSDTGGAS